MHYRVWSRSVVRAVALLTTLSGAQAFDDTKYPNLKGQWDRIPIPVPGQPSFDQTKGWGRLQQAPLTPEYQQILEDSIADQAAGGHGNNVDHARCGASGMPWMMVAFRPIEFVITPEVSYVLVADYDALRRIFTDGRDFPASIEPTFAGYSIGRWIDTDGDGKYDVLEVETRGFKGPRVMDGTGLPLHRDNESVIRERIFLDKSDPNVFHDEITVIDHALTRPWTVDKRYVRNPDRLANWPEMACNEVNAQIFIGKDNYYLSADGYLMPARKGQKPPDLKYFNQPAK
jgi:hypothetical protein